MAPEHSHTGVRRYQRLSLPIGSVTGFAVAPLSTVMAEDIEQETGKVSNAEVRERGGIWLQHGEQRAPGSEFLIQLRSNHVDVFKG